MNHQEYNGWYNYETWLFDIHFSPDDFKEEIEELRREIPNGSIRQRILLSEHLSNWFDEYIDGQIKESGFLTALLNSAASEVNFDDIAETWLSK